MGTYYLAPQLRKTISKSNEYEVVVMGGEKKITSPWHDSENCHGKKEKSTVPMTVLIKKTKKLQLIHYKY